MATKPQKKKKKKLFKSSMSNGKQTTAKAMYNAQLVGQPTSGISRGF